LTDPDIRPSKYYGGDLAGVTQKIKDGYFTSTRINSYMAIANKLKIRLVLGAYTRPRTKLSGYQVTGLYR
jgi:hypothetical protein